MVTGWWAGPGGGCATDARRRRHRLLYGPIVFFCSTSYGRPRRRTTKCGAKFESVRNCYAFREEFELGIKGGGGRRFARSNIDTSDCVLVLVWRCLVETTPLYTSLSLSPRYICRKTVEILSYGRSLSSLFACLPIVETSRRRGPLFIDLQGLINRSPGACDGNALARLGLLVSVPHLFFFPFNLLPGLRQYLCFHTVLPYPPSLSLSLTPRDEIKAR